MKSTFDSKVMIKLYIIGMLLLIIGLLPPMALCSDYIPIIASIKAFAGDDLSVRNKSDLLTISNASFVRLNDNETINILDLIYEKFGCSEGRKNLILLRSNPSHPFYLFFFNKERKKAAYFEIPLNLAPKSLPDLKPEEIFSKAKLFDVPWDEILKNASGWEKRLKSMGMGPNELKLVSVALLWTVGLPQEVVKAIEIHDHLCPGVLSGLFIGNLLLSELPPQQDTSYFWIGSPVWCKEDLILSMLNTTPGKRNIFLFPLSDESKKHLKDKNSAGILIQTSRKTGEGKGIVVGFDWERLRKDTGITGEISKWEERLITSHYMLNNYKHYQKYAYVIKKFEIQKGDKPESYIEQCTNPWKKLTLWIEEEKKVE